MRKDPVNKQDSIKIFSRQCLPVGEKYYSFSDWYCDKAFWFLFLYSTSFSSVIIFLTPTLICSISLHHKSLIIDSLSFLILLTLPFFAFFSTEISSNPSWSLSFFFCQYLITRMFLQKCHNLQIYNFIFSEFSRCSDI